MIGTIPLNVCFWWKVSSTERNSLHVRYIEEPVNLGLLMISLLSALTSYISARYAMKDAPKADE